MIDDNANLHKDERGTYYIRFPHCNNIKLAKLAKKNSGVVRCTVTKCIEYGTAQQNKLAHLLLSEYYKTACHSAPEGSTEDFFKLWCKAKWGPCHSMTIDGTIVKIPVSWVFYTKEERTKFITSLKSEIEQSGAAAESDKIQEILAGLEENKRKEG